MSKTPAFEPTTCPQQQGHPFGQHRPEAERVDRVCPNGDRCCWFCGSWHRDQFMAFVQSILDGTQPAHRMLQAPAIGEAYPTLSLADHRHKVYISRNDVGNAGDGAIKFYVCHARDQGDIDLINEALRKCRAACADAEAAAKAQ